MFSGLKGRCRGSGLVNCSQMLPWPESYLKQGRVGRPGLLSWSNVSGRACGRRRNRRVPTRATRPIFACLPFAVKMQSLYEAPGPAPWSQAWLAFVQAESSQPFLRTSRRAGPARLQLRSGDPSLGARGAPRLCPVGRFSPGTQSCHEFENLVGARAAHTMLENVMCGFWLWAAICKFRRTLHTLPRAVRRPQSNTCE